MLMTTDEDMIADAIARFAGTVTRYPPGKATAPEVKEYGQAHFRCSNSKCGYMGTMPYPKLFKRLRLGDKPLLLRCERCGRALR